MHSASPRWRRLAVAVLTVAVMAVAYTELIRTGNMRALVTGIHHLGAVGVVLGVLLQSIINIVPLPGEFTSVMLMELYGAVWGGILSYLGGLFGAIGAYFVIGMLAAPFRTRLSSHAMYAKIESLLDRRSWASLLLIRFLPLVPYHLVNYVCGTMRIRIRSYVWTTAIGLIPFHTAMSLIYAGFKTESYIGLIAGAILFLLLAAAGWYISNRRKRLAKEPA